MTITPQTDEGYKLLHYGVIALSQVEANGMKIDTAYLDWAIESTEKKVKTLTKSLQEDPVWKTWRKRFGLEANLDSREQLGAILFDPVKKGGLGYEPKGETESGDRYATDESALESLGLPFIDTYLKIQKLDKALSTNLRGIKRELDEFGFLHPVFNLHTVSTYRSSSDTPNFQNIPVRNPEIGKLIRRAFVARPGHVIVENDFKGIEVGVAACYHLDPVMIAYIKDPTKDMHRDMAMQLFILTKAEWKAIDSKVAKAIRHAAKNKFVFPQFYGDWYLSCARALWEEIDRTKLKGPDGKSLKEHLKARGITELGACDPEKKPVKGTFEKHVQEVENDFWNNRFGVYGKWKRKWFDEYQRKGYFDTHTGFRIAGVMARNQVINFPVQGSAFHCLLWSFIQIQKELRKRRMRTKIVGQIHDSIIADVHIEELDEYLAIVRDVTTRRLREQYKWIIVPLEVECEICPENSTWHDKRPVKIVEEGYSDESGQYKGSARGLIKFWNQQQKAANEQRN